MLANNGGACLSASAKVFPGMHAMYRVLSLLLCKIITFNQTNIGNNNPPDKVIIYIF